MSCACAYSRLFGALRACGARESSLWVCGKRSTDGFPGIKHAERCCGGQERRHIFFISFPSLSRHTPSHSSSPTPPLKPSRTASSKAFSLPVSQATMHLRVPEVNRLSASCISRQEEGEHGRTKEEKHKCMCVYLQPGRQRPRGPRGHFATHDTICLQCAVACGLVEAPGLDVFVTSLDRGTSCVKPVQGDVSEGSVPVGRVTPVEKGRVHTLSVV